MEKPNKRISSGREYYSYGLYKTKGVAQKVWSGVPAFPSNGIELYGVGISPLDKMESSPDVVLVIGNPIDMMRLVQGSVYGDGERMNMNISAMQGMCSEVTAIPYLTGKMNITLLCPSTRTLAKWKDSEMVAGIPSNIIDKIMDGVEEIIDIK